MTAPRNEEEQIARVAKEYRDKGYRTVVQPKVSQLPGFLRTTKPDLIAYGADEQVVVEIKYREPSAGDRKLKAIAKAVEAKPGWRFELVQLSPPKTSASHRLVAKPIGRDDVRARLSVARRLASKQPDLALLVGWSAVEGAMRGLFKETWSDETLKPAVMLKQAYSSGWIGWRNFEQLVKLMEKRNAIAHGLHSSTTTRDAFLLLDLAEHLVVEWNSPRETESPKRRLVSTQAAKKDWAANGASIVTPICVPSVRNVD